MRRNSAAQRITTAYDGVRTVYGNKAIAKTTAPAPHQYAHQGAGTGTNHDPNHGGIT